MSSPEVERFEMSDADLNQMYDPTGVRRRQTKNQATYGIWADKESDDSDNEMVGFSGRGRRKKQQSSGIGSGISFVSGGLKEEQEKEEEIVENVSWIKKKKESVKEMPIPRYLKGHLDDRNREFGSWEKHTKGIGQKLLAKMGHRPGEGLGKSGQGITAPVEAFLRKGRGAIGAHGRERSDKSLKDFPVKDKDEEEEKSYQKQLSQWKKQPVEAKKQKPKYVYKTAQEVLETGAKKRKPVVESGPKVKVIDMTGREQRVLSGYHAIGKTHDQPDEAEDLIRQEPEKMRAFSMPELMHNLGLLVDMAEDEIIHNDRKLRHNRDQIVNLEHERDRLEVVVSQEGKQLDRLKTVMDLVLSCEERTRPDSTDPLTLDSCAETFKLLQQDFYEEYKIYDMPSLAVALVFPLMKKFLESWLPLQDPTFGLLTVLEWQLLLGADESMMMSHDRRLGGHASMDVYQRLIWDVWLPPVRATILKWRVRDTDAMITLLETWKPAIPPWVLENILDQLVLPLLLQEVENWNPLTDTMPIHCWLHPWLPLMGDKLEPLYAPIRHKIASALTSWHPSDISAKIILEPWLGVFRPGHMSAFLVKNILPKLEMEIQSLTINPHQQFLDSWRWVMSWNDLMPVQAMVTMLEKAFFPKWQQVLVAWLSNLPNYEDITKWYLGWKAQFPENLLGHPSIKDQFNKALETMNRAVSGAFVPGIKENIAYFTLTEKRRIMDSRPTSMQPGESEMSAAAATRVGVSVPTTFKDLVERKAEQEDLLYIPVPGRTHEGKQVYRFGKASLCYDHNMIYMQDSSGRWLPASISQLTEAAK